MSVRIKRLFHGYASVRDYIVTKHIQDRKDLIIDCNNETMVIPWTKLDQGYKNDDVFVSKHNHREYSLIDYDWKPVKQQLSFI